MNDTEYERRVKELYAWGSALFKTARQDAALLAAAHAYYVRGKEEGFSTEELVDFLGVSTPSVLSAAGFAGDEEVRIMKLISNKLDIAEQVGGTLRR